MIAYDSIQMFTLYYVLLVAFTDWVSIYIIDYKLITFGVKYGMFCK